MFTGKEKDPLVIAKLFDPCGSATWHLTEYDPEQKIPFFLFLPWIIKKHGGVCPFVSSALWINERPLALVPEDI